MSHVSHRSTLPPPPDRVGRLTGTAALSVHATSIAGGTQRDPEGTSREPRRRCYGHRRGISLPKALYQNAARMSRGAEGTTEASGRRDQAGLAARKRRVGAVRGAVPAQNEPKSDRPRAKTPMNRRKSRLRRRAAPNSIIAGSSPTDYNAGLVQGFDWDPPAGDVDTDDDTDGRRWVRIGPGQTLTAKVRRRRLLTDLPSTSGVWSCMAPSGHTGRTKRREARKRYS